MGMLNDIPDDLLWIVNQIEERGLIQHLAGCEYCREKDLESQYDCLVQKYNSIYEAYKDDVR